MQVLDGSVIAQIFMGNISSWADPAILALNPNLTSANLPDQPILMSYTETDIGTAGSQVFKNALSIFSTEFARVLEAAGGYIANLTPTAEGRALQTDNPTDRFAYVGVSRILTFFPGLSQKTELLTNQLSLDV
jgi:hypothetical protein